MNKHISNQILIALLKQFGVKKLVLSSGMRNIPFVSQVETDSDFQCFSVVDERNAAFFAMGLSQQGDNEPVAVACTSGTAASNYLTGVTEAYYSHVPLVVITFDRSPYVLDQLETQKINQPAIFSPVTKKSVCLPVIKDDEDVWYCQRLINEALIAMRQHSTGPVHLNVPLGGDTTALNIRADASIACPRMIRYYSCNNPDLWEEPRMVMRTAQRVLLIMGQQIALPERTVALVKRVISKNRIPVLADNLCNFRCDEMIMAEALIKGLSAETIRPLLPELVITVGANFQERIKDLLKAHQGEFSHWGIDGDGVVRDVFRSQTTLFESSTEQFFTMLDTDTDLGVETLEGRERYLALWRKYECAMTLPELQWSNLFVAKKFSEKIPNNSILHLSILNSTRVHQFFKLDGSIRVYSNVNTFGIDGCLPTFMGQAAAEQDKLAFIVIGDLSFFYGMNALAIKHVERNVRVMVVNNKGAAEFHIQPDSHKRPTTDLHIGCAHDRNAKGWAMSLGYKYLSADNEKAFDDALTVFTDQSDSPILLEVFTDHLVDGPQMLSVYRHLEGCVRTVQQEA